MKTWIKFLIILIFCLGAVFGAYVWRFGLPKLFDRDDQTLSKVYSMTQEYIDTTELDNIQINMEDNKINFNIGINGEKQIVEFKHEDGIISTIIDENIINKQIRDKIISIVFMAVAKNSGYDAENAQYSIIPDIIKNKTLEDDGFQITSMNGVTRFMAYTGKKLGLANRNDVYIKSEDISSIHDILKSKLQYRLIEKPGIVLEKNVSYSNNIVFVIYEEGNLTQRSYNSLMTVLNELTDKSFVKYVKDNYPQITKNGTLTLDNISISLNEKLGEGNIHYYEKPESYEYLMVRINIDIIK